MQYIRQDDANNDFIIYKSKKEIKTRAYRAIRKMKTSFYLSLFIFLFSPLGGTFFLFFTFYYFFNDIYMPIFMNAKLFDKYYTTFAPVLDESAISAIGYKVEWEDIHEHINMISKGSDEDKAAKLQRKQKIMLQVKNMSKWVGLAIRTLTTHVVAIGMTGSGKTEAIRSVADGCMKSGGGFLMNDGKSDEKMFIEIATQAKDNNRETSLFALNFLKGYKMSETNTINILLMMHPLRGVEFLGSLVEDEGGQGGGGNHKHFFERGKALLAGIMSGLHLRSELYGEDYNMIKILDFRNLRLYVILHLIFYAMSRDIEMLLRNNKALSAMLEAYEESSPNPNLKKIDTLTKYMTQFPQQRDIVEKEIGVKYYLIKEIYSNTYQLTKTYLSGIWNTYDNVLPLVGEVLYAYAKTKNITFFDSNRKVKKISLNAFKDNIYEQVKKNLHSCYSNILSLNGAENYGFKFDVNQDIPVLKKAFYTKKNEGGNIEDISENEMTQHQYAMQIWDPLHKTFVNFNHILGQTHGEIDPLKLVKNNKILYYLIPVMEVGEETIKVLGKMMVALLQEIASIALAGEKLSIHVTIKRIMTDQTKPKPFTLVSLDEYGSYPVPRVDDLAKQLRALLIGLIFGIQNFAGLKTGGNNQTSQENILANSLKWFTKTEDDVAIKWLREMLGEEMVLKSETQVDAYDNLISTATNKIEKEKSFEAEILRNLSNGMSVLVAGSGKDKIIPVQTFYHGGKQKTIFLRKYAHLQDFD